MTCSPSKSLTTGGRAYSTSENYHPVKMKTKIKSILRRLILWAAGEDVNAASQKCVDTAAQTSLSLETQLRRSRNDLVKKNDEQWRILDSKISALQAMDVAFGRNIGKIVIIARVRGQDIVKIIDIPPNMSQRDYTDTVAELHARYGARPEFIDGPLPAIGQHIRRDSDAVSRAAARDRRAEL